MLYTSNICIILVLLCWSYIGVIYSYVDTTPASFETPTASTGKLTTPGPGTEAKDKISEDKSTEEEPSSKLTDLDILEVMLEVICSLNLLSVFD